MATARNIFLPFELSEVMNTEVREIISRLKTNCLQQSRSLRDDSRSSGHEIPGLLWNSQVHCHVYKRLRTRLQIMYELPFMRWKLLIMDLTERILFAKAKETCLALNTLGLSLLPLTRGVMQLL
jgi:hypothetical protein